MKEATDAVEVTTRSLPLRKPITTVRNPCESGKDKVIYSRRVPHVDFESVGMTKSSTRVTNFRSTRDNKRGGTRVALESDYTNNGTRENAFVRGACGLGTVCAVTAGKGGDTLGDKQSFGLSLSEGNAGADLGILDRDNDGNGG